MARTGDDWRRFPDNISVWYDGGWREAPIAIGAFPRR